MNGKVVEAKLEGITERRLLLTIGTAITIIGCVMILFELGPPLTNFWSYRVIGIVISLIGLFFCWSASK